MRSRHEISKDETIGLAFEELFDVTRKLESRLREIEFMAGQIETMLNISMCTVVVRKVSEDKVDELKKLLD